MLNVFLSIRNQPDFCCALNLFFAILNDIVTSFFFAFIDFFIAFKRFACAFRCAISAGFTVFFIFLATFFSSAWMFFSAFLTISTCSLASFTRFLAMASALIFFRCIASSFAGICFLVMGVNLIDFPSLFIYLTDAIGFPEAFENVTLFFTTFFTGAIAHTGYIITVYFFKNLRKIKCKLQIF
ncbi:hypothetical protein PBCV1_A135L [Paramecium bursaria Chlorella virus 1]|uniref:Uncharacterized protein n=1 Tax=Paramecium bursaria Chlorella virus 1 TaxID=10506 RepID=Q84455_PBCV1|nr:hypothetical protein PBCV1_A135L [Paramecium bursaria Chlorella virus 1]AAC96503.1 hypothetical protein [Paramecium bursaria Chlorella virus 1]